MMHIIYQTAPHDVATVYLGAMRGGDRRHIVEFAEARQLPLSIEDKWVIIVSSQFGCPLKCAFCDAGLFFGGNLSAEEILAQIDYPVLRRFPDRVVPVEKFKVQFARMGEPSLNPAVLDALRALPGRFEAPGLLPCLSTTAPLAVGAAAFLDELIEIKNRYYPRGMFQLQFSVHTTDPGRRDELLPFAKWDLAEIAAYGARWFKPGDRKVTLNFALDEQSPLDTDILANHFDPVRFLIKVTPLNPTDNLSRRGLTSFIDPTDDIPDGDHLPAPLQAVRRAGFQLILSIGDTEENEIGSNCGMIIQHHLRRQGIITP